MKSDIEIPKASPSYKLVIKSGENDHILVRSLYNYLITNVVVFAATKECYFPFMVEIGDNHPNNWGKIRSYFKAQGYKHLKPVYIKKLEPISLFYLKLLSLTKKREYEQIGFIMSSKKKIKFSKAVRLYRKYIDNLEDYNNGFVYSIELKDASGMVIEHLQCFSTNLNYEVNRMFRKYKGLIETVEKVSNFSN